ncbi:MAG TPA: ABC transporter permease [Terriglobia bacterium]|nr:ABC transporter permease [Terriglobia bacterium]
MATLIHDLKYAVRMLIKNPGFTVVAVLTLALGIGATVAIFSVVYGVLLRPLPFPKPEQIVSISELASDGHRMNFADPNVRDLRAMNHTLAGMAKADNDEVTISGGNGPARVGVATVSEDFFRVMGVAPTLGREFSKDELREGGTPAAIASYGYWKAHLNGSPDLSTFKLKVEDHVFSVIGVMPPGFNYPGHTDLWLPAEFFGDQSPSRTSHNWSLALARLRDGETLARARADLSAIARQLHQQYQPNIDMADVSVAPLREALTADVRPALLILLGAVGFLLLVGCVNVANLLLARAAARERELAIRAALGAGRSRLIRQFLTESLLLSLLGGALGIFLALWGVEALVALAPPNLPRLEDVSVNLPVLTFALGISVLMAVSLGLVTALRATAADPQAALAEGSRAAVGSIASHRLARILIGGQMAVTLVLLVGAGLLGRSLLQVLSVDPGFRTTQIVTMELEVPSFAGGSAFDFAGMVANPRPANFMSDLFDRLRAIPGVVEVGGVSVLPLGAGGDCPDGKFLLLNQQPQFDMNKPEEMARLDRLWNTAPGGVADYCVASAAYFRALGIPLIRGRFFDEHDTAGAPQAAVVSESMARATWPNQNPLGHTIEFGNMDGDMRLLTVVGVVPDVHQRSLEKPAEPTVYVNYQQRLRGGRDFTVVMRVATPPAVLVSDARQIVRELAPDVAPRFQTFQDVFSASLDSRRFNLLLVGVFAVSALVLAAVGIFGVMAYWVSQRTREIGVRMALGAGKAEVVWLVLRQSVTTVVAGIAAGVFGAFALTRAVKSLLFGVTPTDPITFAGVALLLTIVAILASYVPARRATKVDPMVALRYE